MEKPWDFKALGEELKKQGLPMLEDGAEKAYAAFSKWIKDSATLAGGMYLVIPPIMVAVDGVAKEQLDKIDGQPG